MNYKIGFIGAGKMADAIINGIIKAELIEKKNISVTDVSKERVEYFHKDGINSYANNSDLAKNCDIIILSVKPDKVKEVSSEIKSVVEKNKLIISIAAGITLGSLAEYLEKDSLQLIRVMPNTPALVGAGMSVYTYNTNMEKKYIDFIEKFLNSFGEGLFMEEKYFDAVTGLSGSGPAYIFMIINALADGGVKMGLPKNIALKLASQTVFGAGKLAIETGVHPEQLKDMVSSPGGTTVEGTYILEKNNIRASLIEAVVQATLKSKSLARN